MQDPVKTNRRQMLKTLGAGAAGGAAFVGTTSASATTNFAYVDDDVTGGTYSLDERVGRSQPGCGVQQPRCVKFKAEDGTIFNTIPSSYEVGDTIEVGDEIVDCPGPLHEVGIDLVRE